MRVRLLGRLAHPGTQGLDALLLVAPSAKVQCGCVLYVLAGCGEMIGHTFFPSFFVHETKKAKQWMAHFLVERASRIQAGQRDQAEVAYPVGQ